MTPFSKRPIALVMSILCLCLFNACANEENTAENESPEAMQDGSISGSSQDAGSARTDASSERLTDMDAMDSSVSVDAQSQPRDARAQPVDVNTVDARVPIDMMVPPMRVDCDLNIELTSPALSTFVHIDEDVVFTGTVTDAEGQAVAAAEIQLIDERERSLGQAATDELGVFSVTLTAQELGQRLLSAEPVVMLGSDFCGPNNARKVYRCLQTFNESFNTAPENWTILGDATWDARGWLEMTGNQGGRKGAVYNNVDAISSGLASIEFVMATGGGINGGADGFALTIIDIADSTELDNLIDHAASGGGLGYAVAPGFGRDEFEWVGDAVTVEIDTWYNEWLDRGANLLDPTRQNHIALTRNANPGDHIVWHAVPNVEDLMSHTVRIDLLGNSIRITYDGNVVIEEPVQFAFKGGYLFFSGSTGWATNFHRFDALDILSNCF